MDVRDEALPYGILAVFDQQHPVELALDLGVGDAALVYPVLDVRMALAVQGEVAYEPVEVRFPGSAIPDS